MSIRTRINGAEREVEAADHVLLIDMIRGLGLLGTKLSCDTQVCGACTVLLDGKPVSSCTTLAIEADGRRVETIEGLAEGAAALHPLQSAFIDGFAFQCGYCTPGMIVAAKSLLDEHAAPDAETVRRWMDGNICRCTGYETIVDAIISAPGQAASGIGLRPASERTDRARGLAASLNRAAEGTQAEHRVAGTAAPRADGVAKVTGAARYTVDLSAPGMAHAMVVRSTRAHARIRSIDRAAAAAASGVLRVITGDDLLEAGLTPYYGHVVLDHPVLAVGKVRYHGEPVALVVAESRLAADEAADLVTVEYEDLPSVIDADDALRPDAPAIHEVRGERVGDEGMDMGDAGLVGNVCAVSELGWGDVEAAFAKADVVVEGEYRYPMLYGYAMEPYNALALFDQGDLVVWSSAQHVYMVRRDLARMFGLPLARVRVIAPYVGGGYGTKSYTKIEGMAAMAAHLAGRPVKLALSVEEAMLTTRSDAAHIRARSAFSADGRLLARDFDIVMNSGAYTDNSPLVNSKTANRCFGPYRIPALRVRSRSMFTNTVPASSLRGFGAPQGNIAGELQMDEAALRLGIDAVELRLRNLVGPGQELLPGKRPLDADLKDDLRCLADALGWPGVGRGAVGLGVSASDAGAYPTSTAAVRIHSDDSVTLFTGSTELGQGSRTVLSQIVAEDLGVPLEKVSVVGGDTGVVTYERTTGASRTTTVTGRAVQEACADARKRVRDLAAQVFGEQARIEDAAAGVRVDGKDLGYGEVIERWFGAGGEVLGHGAVRKAGGFTQMPPFWEIGCSGVVLSVDRETGVVDVEKLTTIGDVGFAINPALVRGQDAGAAMMGLGAALHEELIYEGDQLVNPNVVDYRVPRFSDVPTEFEHILAQRRDGAGPYGAKGAGEGAGNTIGSSVASAIGRLIGAFPHQLPATPERVWRLIQERAAKSAHPQGP